MPIELLPEIWSNPNPNPNPTAAAQAAPAEITSELFADAILVYPNIAAGKTKSDLQSRYDFHLHGNYTHAAELQEMLQILMLMLNDRNVSENIKVACCLKILEGIDQCTPGFHGRVAGLLYIEKQDTLGDILYSMRRNLVEKAAMINAYRCHEGNQVHQHNDFFNWAIGMGVSPINPTDPAHGEMTQDEILSELNTIFEKEYTLFGILNYMHVQCELAFDYRGPLDTGYQMAQYEPLLAFLNKILHPVNDLNVVDVCVVVDDDCIVTDIDWSKINLLFYTALKNGYIEVNGNINTFIEGLLRGESYDVMDKNIVGECFPNIDQLIQGLECLRDVSNENKALLVQCYMENCALDHALTVAGVLAVLTKLPNDAVNMLERVLPFIILEDNDFLPQFGDPPLISAVKSNALVAADFLLNRLSGLKPEEQFNILRQKWTPPGGDVNKPTTLLKLALKSKNVAMVKLILACISQLDNPAYRHILLLETDRWDTVGVWLETARVPGQKKEIIIELYKAIKKSLPKVLDAQMLQRDTITGKSGFMYLCSGGLENLQAIYNELTPEHQISQLNQDLSNMTPLSVACMGGATANVKFILEALLHHNLLAVFNQLLGRLTTVDIALNLAEGVRSLSTEHQMRLLPFIVESLDIIYSKIPGLTPYSVFLSGLALAEQKAIIAACFASCGDDNKRKIKAACHLMMEFDNADMSEELLATLDKDSFLRTLDAQGLNPIMAAMRYGKSGALQGYLQLFSPIPGDVFAVDCDGKNALMLAMAHAPKSIDALVASMCASDMSNDKWNNALKMALIDYFSPHLPALLSSLSKVINTDNKRFSSLSTCFLECVKSLPRGADQTQLFVYIFTHFDFLKSVDSIIPLVTAMLISDPSCNLLFFTLHAAYTMSTNNYTSLYIALQKFNFTGWRLLLLNSKCNGNELKNLVNSSFHACSSNAELIQTLLDCPADHLSELLKAFLTQEDNARARFLVIKAMATMDPGHENFKSFSNAVKSLRDKLEKTSEYDSAIYSEYDSAIYNVEQYIIFLTEVKSSKDTKQVTSDNLSSVVQKRNVLSALRTKAYELVMESGQHDPAANAAFKLNFLLEKAEDSESVQEEITEQRTILAQHRGVKKMLYDVVNDLGSLFGIDSLVDKSNFSFFKTKSILVAEKTAVALNKTIERSK